MISGRLASAVIAACLALAGCGDNLTESAPLGTRLMATMGPELLAAEVRSISYEDLELLDVLTSAAAVRPGGVVVVEFAQGPAVTLDAMSLPTLRELHVEVDDEHQLELIDGRMAPVILVEVALRAPERPPHLDRVADELGSAARGWLTNALDRRRQLAADAASWN